MIVSDIIYSSIYFFLEYLENDLIWNLNYYGPYPVSQNGFHKPMLISEEALCNPDRSPANKKYSAQHRYPSGYQPDVNPSAGRFGRSCSIILNGVET